MIDAVFTLAVIAVILAVVAVCLGAGSLVVSEVADRLQRTPTRSGASLLASEGL